jgi:hypothetical protein
MCDLYELLFLLPFHPQPDFDLPQNFLCNCVVNSAYATTHKYLPPHMAQVLNPHP